VNKKRKNVFLHWLRLTPSEFRQDMEQEKKTGMTAIIGGGKV